MKSSLILGGGQMGHGRASGSAGDAPPSDRGRFLLGFARREELKLKSEVNESGVSCVSTSLHQFSDCFCVLEIEVMSARV